MTSTKHQAPQETILRKYPNRRLYDPTKNAHVTLAEIADRVKAGERIRIVDHKTGEDLTQVIMGQVLFETLKTRPDYLPLDLVLLMIRAQDNLVRGFLHNFLPQAFPVYLENQRRMMSGMNWFSQGYQGLPGFGAPLSPFFGNQAPANGYPSSAPQAPTSEPVPVPESASDTLKEELERLREEVESLKSRKAKPAKEGKKSSPKAR